MGRRAHFEWNSKYGMTDKSGSYLIFAVPATMRVDGH